MPGLLKLGATTLDPHERARQLTASTSSPTPFFVVYSRCVPDVNRAESMMHERFADRRVNGGREYFQVSVLEACTALDRIAAGEVLSEFKTPYAELFNTFPDSDGVGRELTDNEAAQCRRLKERLAAGAPV